MVKMKKKRKLYNLTFTTRKDEKFIFFIITLITFLLYSCFLLIKFSKYLELCIAILFITLLLSLLLNNKIVLEKYYIRVYYGFFLYKIKYSDIRDIYLDRNHLISLASSHLKVGIKTSKFKGKLFDTFLSPMDREDFIYEVNRRR